MTGWKERERNDKDVRKPGRKETSGKGAAVFADELSAAVDSGMESITHICGSRHCLK